MPRNCGIDALSQLTELKNISAFTLVHAARDNGLNLFVFKVNDLKDLAQVQRPCILHQEDHFIYVKNGETIPQGKYTGFVIGSAVLGRVVGLQEAKFIRGGKNFLTGKNKDGVKEGGGALGAILGVVGAVAGSLILPGVGTALGTSLSTAAGGAIGGAIGGGVGSGVTGDNIPLGIVGGALGGEAIGGGIAGLSAGAANAAASGGSQSLPSAVANFGKGAFNTLSHPIAALGAGGNAIAAPASSLATGGGLAQSFGNAVGGAVGSGTAQGGLTNVGIAAGSNGIGNFTLGNAVFNPAFNAASISTNTPSAAGGIGKTIGNAISSNPIGSAAALAGGVGILGSHAPQPSSVTPGDNYSALNTFLGSTPQGAAANKFGLAATNANTDLVNTSVQDLQKQFTANNQRTLDTINTAYDNQKANLTHSFAQAGQNLSNSSELQKQVTQLEQKRTNDLTLAQQELQDQALGQAIQVKQQALSSGMQAGQFNQTMAMQLASLTGDQQNLQYAIANNDYTSFQQIMGKLLTMGIPQSVNVTNNGQNSTTTRTGGI